MRFLALGKYADLISQNILVASLRPIWVKIADFGVSKREKGTFLHSAIGTEGYFAPELSGLLPRKLRPKSLYTNAVDMWALGCLVHEILTSEIPFLETDLEVDSDEEFPEPQIDNDVVINFCRGILDFPADSLHRSKVGKAGIDFVKGLLVPDPRLRMSAIEARKSPWLSEEPGSETPHIELTPNDPDGLYLQSCHQNLLHFVTTERPGLKSFFPSNDDLHPYAQKAETLAAVLLGRGFTRDIAHALGVLTLYDLVLFIGNLYLLRYLT